MKSAFQSDLSRRKNEHPSEKKIYLRKEFTNLTKSIFPTGALHGFVFTCAIVRVVCGCYYP